MPFTTPHAGRPIVPWSLLGTLATCVVTPPALAQAEFPPDPAQHHAARMTLIRKAVEARSALAPEQWVDGTPAAMAAFAQAHAIMETMEDERVDGIPAQPTLATDTVLALDNWPDTIRLREAAHRSLRIAYEEGLFDTLDRVAEADWFNLPEPLESHGDLRDAFRFAEAALTLACDADDYDAIQRHTRHCIAISRCAEASGALGTIMAAYQDQALAKQIRRWALSTPPHTKEDARVIIGLLAERAADHAAHPTRELAHASLDRFVFEVLEFELGLPPTKVQWLASRPEVRRWLDRIGPILDSGWPTQTVADLRAECDEAEELYESGEDVSTNALANAIGSQATSTRLLMVQTRRGAHAALNGTITLVGVESFRRLRGAPPKTLEDLAPFLLDNVPTDPIAGAPLVYRRTQPISQWAAPGSGYVLYAPGFDGTDDQGIPSMNGVDYPDAAPDGTDLVFTRYPR